MNSNKKIISKDFSNIRQDSPVPLESNHFHSQTFITDVPETMLQTPSSEKYIKTSSTVSEFINLC